MLVNDKEQRIKEKIQEITKISTDINKNVCTDLIKDYRVYKIKKILLLSSSFDYFLLEEEGRLNALFKEWCAFSEDTNPPTIRHVETGKELIDSCNKENFDIIIIFNKPQDKNIKEISKEIKKKSDVPIVLLYNDINELSKIVEKKDVKIDKAFTWNGDGKMILSIVQFFEDKKNLESLSDIDYKSCIFLIEDSIQHYSTYLALIHEEICNYLSSVINNELNCEQKTLRYKRRPFILHTDEYEDSLNTYEKYKNNLLFILTDNYLEKDGKSDQIAVEIVKKVSNEKPDLPVLVQSSEPLDKKDLKGEKIKFISKTSHTLIASIKNFIRKNLGPKKLIFKDTEGKEVHKVRKMSDLKKAISTVDKKSLLTCAKNKDISDWLKSIGEIEIADRC